MSKYTRIIAALGVAAGLGVAALPAAGVFADSMTLAPAGGGDKTSATHNLQITVSDTINIDSATYTNPDAVRQGGTKTGSAEIKVSTSHGKGYNLTMTGKDGKTDLEGPTKNGSSDKDTFAAAADITNGGWNMTVTGGAAGTKVLAADGVIVGTASEAVHEDTTGITYNFTAKDDQTAGDYALEVTYTAAVKNS